MNIKNQYKKRPVRFMEIIEHEGWKIKLYSISMKNEMVNEVRVGFAKRNIEQWLRRSADYKLTTYKIATLILHEGNEGCYAIINWWIDENMLQQFVYLAANDKPDEFVLYSDKGIITCVWEMAILWFERNAWVENVLMKAKHPDFVAYLNTQLNADV